jgi:hypothetical protein
LDLARDVFRHVPFQSKNVAEISLLCIRPEMPVRWAMNQLRSDSDTIAGALGASLDDAVHSQVVRNLGQRLPGLLVLHRGDA